MKLDTHTLRAIRAYSAATTGKLVEDAIVRGRDIETELQVQTAISAAVEFGYRRGWETAMAHKTKPATDEPI